MPHSAKVSPRGAELLNATNNSGIISHAQFSDGGFGDIGLQWRNVSVAGSVKVVHNTLAVDTTADPSPTDVPGPITVSNVTFNSGALSGRLPRSRNQIIVVATGPVPASFDPSREPGPASSPEPKGQKRIHEHRHPCRRSALRRRVEAHHAPVAMCQGTREASLLKTTSCRSASWIGLRRPSRSRT